DSTPDSPSVAMSTQTRPRVRRPRAPLRASLLAAHSVLPWARFWLVPVVGMMAGAYLGAFLGALRRMRSREHVPASQAGMRDAGVILATHVSESTADAAIAVLRDAGAAEIEQANGVWEDGEWRDFDPRERVLHANVAEDAAEPTIGVAANDRPSSGAAPDRRRGRDATRASPRRTDWL
ncbi:MAG: hypothetical protein P4M06_19695, partial [Pandoraea sp.]|nr:hypothetical protein [Pandoraea sp.]